MSLLSLCISFCPPLFCFSAFLLCIPRILPEEVSAGWWCLRVFGSLGMGKSLGCLAGLRWCGSLCVCVRKDLGCLDEITWHHAWQFGMVRVGRMCLLGSLGDLPLWGSAVSGVWLERGGGVRLWACSPQELTRPWWAEWSVWRREREGAEWLEDYTERERGKSGWQKGKLRERRCAFRWIGLRERSVCGSPQNSHCLSFLLTLPRRLIGFLKSSHC